MGMLNFEEESYGVRLWLSNESDFRRNHDWLLDSFPRDVRAHSLLLLDTKTDNILQPQVLVINSSGKKTFICDFSLFCEVLGSHGWYKAACFSQDKNS